MMRDSPQVLDSFGKEIKWISVYCVDCKSLISFMQTAEVVMTPIILCKDCYTKLKNNINKEE